MVCPAWLGYFLASPIRKLIHPPQTILTPYVREGMTVLDIGCGMGFFSIPLAQMVGAAGKVICVDMQEKMLKRLEKRAQKAGVSARIETRLCSSTYDWPPRSCRKNRLRFSICCGSRSPRFPQVLCRTFGHDSTIRKRFIGRTQRTCFGRGVHQYPFDGSTAGVHNDEDPPDLSKSVGLVKEGNAAQSDGI